MNKWVSGARLTGSPCEGESLTRLGRSLNDFYNSFLPSYDILWRSEKITENEEKKRTREWTWERVKNQFEERTDGSMRAEKVKQCEEGNGVWNVSFRRIWRWKEFRSEMYLWYIWNMNKIRVYSMFVPFLSPSYYWLLSLSDSLCTLSWTHHPFDFTDW